MDWGKIAETTIGTFTGGAIALASMWIKELIDSRKAAQVWFEQYYIAEGVDRLLSHVRLTHMQMAALNTGRHVAAQYGKIELPPGVEKFPKSEAHEALVRLETLFNNDVITVVIAAYRGEGDNIQKIPPGLRSETAITSAAHHLRNLYTHLRTIRAELLKVEVKQKSDINNVPNRPGIKQALTDLVKFNDEWLATKAQRDQLIEEGK